MIIKKKNVYFMMIFNMENVDFVYDFLVLCFCFEAVTVELLLLLLCTLYVLKIKKKKMIFLLFK